MGAPPVSDQPKNRAANTASVTARHTRGGTHRHSFRRAKRYAAYSAAVPRASGSRQNRI